MTPPETPPTADDGETGIFRVTHGIHDTTSPRATVLAAVERAAGPVTVTELAEKLRLHPTTVRCHLHRLIDSGLVTAEPASRRTDTSGESGAASRRGRPRMLYSPAPGDPTSSLITVLAAQLGGTTGEQMSRAAEAGRLWVSGLRRTGQYSRHPRYPGESTAVEQDHGALTAVVRVFTALGFIVRPTVTDDGTWEFTVCSCPLQQLSRQYPEVVQAILCGITEEALPSGTVADTVTVSAAVTSGDATSEMVIRVSGAQRDSDLSITSSS